MNFKILKKDDKVSFHGVQIDREYRGENLYDVTVTFADGSFFKVSRCGWSDMEFLVKAPPKMVKKYVVKGQEGGKQFECKFLTWESANALCSAGHIAEHSITEVEEPEE